MCLTLQRGGVSAACVVLAVWTASAAELSRYREFELGSSVAAVTAVTLSAERDLKILHNRPALLQEVTWQPRYMTGAPVADRNSIGEMVFSFVDDRLFKMTVVYERGRTTGLTNADMIAALTELYGAPTGKAALPRAAYIHVPFCRHRCGYCNFTLVAGRDDLIEAFLEAVAHELARLSA